MYLRAVHAEFNTSALQHFIKENPLGVLITAFRFADYPTIQCTHIPWVLDIPEASEDDKLGTLRGHLARANPHSKSMRDVVKDSSGTNGFLEEEVSVLFNGPAHAYVTPKFYTKTKPETGKVVPTWNYSAVQAFGKARILWDANDGETSSFLQKQISELSSHAETSVMNYTGGDRPSAWEVSDAPDSFIELLKKSIMGIEIEITRLEGKHKMSQEMGAEDRQGVIAGFKSLGTDVGRHVAGMVEERGAMKDIARMGSS
ncbi:transcriptional regulator PAI 2-type [Xylariaceae sp. FL0255]|nr:transcriptional regulator PAI 2-type [Xylariaceae sp. FL0255]